MTFFLCFYILLSSPRTQDLSEIFHKCSAHKSKLTKFFFTSPHLNVQEFSPDQGTFDRFFTILQDIEAGIVLFQRELFIPSDERNETFFVALFNFRKHQNLEKPL
jgi:hypothetical protein